MLNDLQTGKDRIRIELVARLKERQNILFAKTYFYQVHWRFFDFGLVSC